MPGLPRDISLQSERYYHTKHNPIQSKNRMIIILGYWHMHGFLDINDVR